MHIKNVLIYLSFIVLIVFSGCSFVDEDKYVNLFLADFANVLESEQLDELDKWFNDDCTMVNTNYFSDIRCNMLKVFENHDLNVDGYQIEYFECDNLNVAHFSISFSSDIYGSPNCIYGRFFWEEVGTRIYITRIIGEKDDNSTDFDEILFGEYVN